MVSEKDFFGRSGKEDNDMTSDLTADKERLTNERRKRKQLERVRQVERIKRRLKIGILSGFLVVVFGLGAIRWYQNRQAEEMWQEAYQDEAGSDDTKETENKNVAAANGCEDHTITQDNKR